MIGNYKVVVTDDVQKDLDNFVYYLLVEKLNEQAAKALLDDYDASIDRLSEVAGSLKHLEDPELSEYRKERRLFPVGVNPVFYARVIPAITFN